MIHTIASGGCNVEWFTGRKRKLERLEKAKKHKIRGNIRAIARGRSVSRSLQVWEGSGL